MEVQVKTARQIFENIIYIVCSIILLPLTIIDFMYGLSSDNCLLVYPKNIHIHLKKYLLVSAFLQLTAIVFFIYEIIIYYSNKKSSVEYLVFSIAFQLFINLFQLLWNIIGSIVFWGYIYKVNLCNISISNYMFSSLIIKFILNYIIMISIKKE
jgi:hypothetical protein